MLMLGPRLQTLTREQVASLYEAFPLHEARRILERFEFHYTPNRFDFAY